MDLELRHLRTLCAIADAGSLGRAADSLKQLAAGDEHPTAPDRAALRRGPVRAYRVGSPADPDGLEVLTQARDILARADAIRRRPAGTASSAPGPAPCGDQLARPVRHGRPYTQPEA